MQSRALVLSAQETIFWLYWLCSKKLVSRMAPRSCICHPAILQSLLRRHGQPWGCCLAGVLSQPFTRVIVFLADACMDTGHRCAGQTCGAHPGLHGRKQRFVFLMSSLTSSFSSPLNLARWMKLHPIVMGDMLCPGSSSVLGRDVWLV